jgi:hypothetical protein
MNWDEAHLLGDLEAQEARMRNTTHEAPERIWIAEDEIGNPWWTHERNEDMDEYVRADLVQAAVAAALREAASVEIVDDPNRAMDPMVKHAILALITPDAQAALDRVVAAERERWQNMSMVGFANQMTTRSIAAIREGSNERSEEGE